MSKKSKKYLEAVAKVPEEPIAPLAAMGLVKEISTANFDETVTADFRLGIDTRQADQQLRGTVSLPNGSGKTVRVAVFAEGEAARAAEEAGADIVGTDELMAQVQAGEFNFDAAVATPDQMGKVGRLGKILGPRGLMPNPKLGTVTNDVAKAINELKGGRVEYRADRYGIAHVIIGKVSFTPRAAGRELRRGVRRDPAHEAVGSQGQVREVHHRGFHHEPGRQGGLFRDAQLHGNRVAFGHDTSKAFTRGIGRTLWSTVRACRPRMRSGTFRKASIADPTRRLLESEWLFGQAWQGSCRKGSSDPFLFGFQCDIIFISTRPIDRWTFDRHPV